MNTLQQDLILTVLKNTINELIITNRGKYTASYIIKKEPIHIRFQSKLHESVYKQMDPFQSSDKKLNEIRLDWEINSIITIIIKTFEEFRDSLKFDLILESIQNYQNETKDEEELLKEYKINCELIGKLKTKLKNHLTNSEVKIHCRQEMLNTLKIEFDNIKCINALELDLVKRWEETRVYQGELLGTKKVEEVQNDIKDYEFKINSENRFIQEIQDLNELKFKQFESSIELWNNKYDTDIKEWTEKINETVTNIKVIKEKYEKHMKIYEERKKFIEEYLLKKAEEQQQIDVQLKRVRSAIKIQAWWRGTMVRRCLGPYKKKKKGRKGKKGK